VSRIIDLSHPLTDGQPAFPGDPVFRARSAARIAREGYNLSRLSMGTHQGTHVDAPFHFFDDGRTIDRVPLDRFCGPARLIDLRRRGPLKAGTRITREMLLPHAAVFRVGGRVVYRTGWERHWGTASFYRDYPSLTPEAAAWIASRRIRLLGMDTPGPGEEWLECHRILLARGVEIAILESLANLGQVPGRFTLVACPLRIAGLDGSPVRAIAMV
jgi:arylformamidase